MKITPTQDEDVIEQVIELPKPDMPLEDYILLGYSEKDKGKTEQIPPANPINQSSFFIPEGARLIIDSVSRNRKISKTKTTLFLTKSGITYIDYLESKYSNIPKCLTLIKEIAEKSLDTEIDQSHDPYLDELEKKFPYSVDKKGIRKESMRLFWWVSNAIGRHSEALCLQKVDILVAAIYYSAYSCKDSVSQELKQKCKNDLVELELFLSSKDKQMISLLSECTTKNITGELLVKKDSAKYEQIKEKIKEAYPEVYDNVLKAPFEKNQEEGRAVAKKDAAMVDEQEQDLIDIHEIHKTARALVSYAFNRALSDFSITLADGSNLSFRNIKNKDREKNKK